MREAVGAPIPIIVIADSTKQISRFISGPPSITAIFFGALRTGANTMQRTLQVPVSLVNVIQGLVILFVLMQALLSRFTIRIIQRNAKEKGAKQHA